MLDKTVRSPDECRTLTLSQSSFCDRRRPAALVQTSCPPIDVIGAPRGARVSVRSRGDRAMSFPHCPGKWMTATSLFLRQGSPQQQQQVLGVVPLGSKTWARWAQVLAKQHLGAGLGSLNCARTALQSTGSGNDSQLFEKIAGKKNNLGDPSSSFEGFHKSSWC